MTPQDLMAKAIQAIASARVLLDTNDTDGSCNRAYYAMFDAARAALLTIDLDAGKTHRGVLNLFSEHFVKSGLLPKETGRLLKQAETFRCVADYEGGCVEMSDAVKMVDNAVTFVAAMQGFMPAAK